MSAVDLFFFLYLLLCFGFVSFRKRFFSHQWFLVIFHHKVKMFVFLLSYFFDWQTCRIPMIDRICVESCKHNSRIPKLRDSVAHQICHSRSETSHASIIFSQLLSSPPWIKSFTVGTNSIHQHSASLQQLGIYFTTYFGRVEDFLPVGRIQAKHTHELGKLTHQTGNNAAHRGKCSQHIAPWLRAERGCGSRKEPPWPGWLLWLLQRGDLRSKGWRVCNYLEAAQMFESRPPKVDTLSN